MKPGRKMDFRSLFLPRISRACRIPGATNCLRSPRPAFVGSSRPISAVTAARRGLLDGYDMAHLTGDLVGLLDALELKKAVFCGHDWGGLVVWQVPIFHADRVAGVIGVNTPFLPRAPIDLIMAMRASFR